MRKVSLFIAMSLAGFIADSNGNVDWLKGHDDDNNDIDTYSEFVRDIDTILMGGIPIIKLLQTFHRITLLGSGIRLFENVENQIELKLTDTQAYNGMVELIYVRR